MALSRKQRIICDFIREGRGEITKKEATELLRREYYANAQKYVGEILTNIVKRGILCRVKRGTYKFKTYPNGFSKCNKYHISERQISLF